ncbi:type I polyketide synthase [Actinokineospora auranticolor]|uniref:6-deoxyerythronolide-B synthase n=1 Tax=Actinokineospora auranticolor TaxID=155976 RepID=A0A2S6H1P7_9PSEU|nr:type I polyketide synthase [Actinokineospora auranticolor]PPK71409.1 pimaricinolide synthase PimS1 [Actinokineospora auranticolor]
MFSQSTGPEPIAVVGVACRLPGAPDPTAFWRLLADGGSGVGAVPAHRVDPDALARQVELSPGARFGGYLEHIDRFDPEFFGLSPREAAATDPQQRLVLELAWEALEDAGIRPRDLRDGPTGVFVGSIADEYAALAKRGHITRHTLAGTTRGVIANRVSYALGLRGPSIVVDTAQSSSLVAVHLAVESLRRGESEVAIAGGVNLIVDPAGTAVVAEFGGLSPDGRCHTFDTRANGYVRGEGAALVVLKPLANALADGDDVYAVILGGAVNNDGAGQATGLTVPDADAQADVIRAARAAAGVTADEVQYVELHGTGTPVGDPVEARGLALAGPADVAVGSVKTNVGHLEGAAGVTGLVKTVLSLRHRHIPATLNHVEAAVTGVDVRTEGGDWPRPDERLVAGVSSFGMGGTNCHLVLAEAPAQTHPAATTAGPLLLSARTPAALRALATAVAAVETDHAAVARALATTRTAFAVRAAVTGDVRAGLAAVAAGETGVIGDPTPEAERFVAGDDVDWTAVFGPRGARVPLPTYPFQRQRYWLDTAPTDAAARPADLDGIVAAELAAVLGHPDAVDRTATWSDLGLDSLGVTELRDRLTAALGVEVTTADIYGHPTAAALTDRLRGPRPKITTTRRHRDETDPVVIVGMGCRYPGGVTSPEDLWRLVLEGRDATSEFPTDRGWDLDTLFADDRPGTTYTRRGGFLHDVADFDAEFFGLSPREALATDPQQRLLLQVTWEALERAGIDPLSLKGTETGVYIGATTSDYTPRLHEGDGSLDGYLLTGGTPSVASGRIAYVLGLSGPALTVDTACSSSLVALDLAVRSVRSGECSLAVAGGATVLASPGMFVEFARQRGLSPDGRCRAFGDGADGTGWAEGVGVVVVERLSTARAAGRPVLAVVAGTGVNSDGASNGLTAPSGSAQERVIARALGDAGLGPSDVDLVEAHGTGTRLGDPIEAQALIAVYGGERDRPLLLGSLKSNIGHSQAAAGVGGVIKVVQALRHGTVPRTLHADAPTPHVTWADAGVRVASRQTPWPRVDRPRRAGVSSFGISGTNAHVIIEQAPTVDEAGVDVPVLLTAPDQESLVRQAKALLDNLRDAPAGEIGAVLATRARHQLGIAVHGESIADALRSFVDGEPHDDVVRGARRPGKTVFVFPGQGSQWVGMARALLDESPVFRAEIEACAAAFAPHTDWSLLDVLAGDGAELARVDVVQPALFAVMVSLAALWRAHGVEPDAVIGHSQGEIAAAYVAGALSLTDAAKVVTLRSQAIIRITGDAGMTSVALSADDLAEVLPTWGGALEIAARNAPRSTVVAGAATALDELAAWCDERGVRARRVPVDYASHTRAVEPLEPHLAAALTGITPRATGPAFYSAVTATRLTGTELDAGYWYTNLRSQVRFADAVTAALADGHDRFIEVSAHPVLVGGIEAVLDGAGGVLGSLRRDRGDTAEFRRALAAADLVGAPVRWPRPGRWVDVPTYAFEPRRFWLAPTARSTDRDGHPVLGALVPLADGGAVASGVLDPAIHTWVADHSVLGTVLVPGTALVDLIAHAVPEGLGSLTLEAPLPLAAVTRVQVRVSTPDEVGKRSVSLHSRTGDGDWTRHAHAVAGPVDLPAGHVDPVGDPIDVSSVYTRLYELGYDYGPRFQGLTAAWREGDTVVAEVAAATSPDGYGLHPSVLDAALHPVVAGLTPITPGAAGRPLLPFAAEGVRLPARAEGLRVRIEPLGESRVRLVLADGDGVITGGIDSLSFRPLTPTRPPVHRVDWRPATFGTADATVLPGAGDTTFVTGTGQATDTFVLPIASGTGHTPSEALALTTFTVAELQRVLAEPDGRVIVVRRSDDLAAAAADGLVRSAAAEHPGRVALVVVDEPTPVEVIAGIREPEARVTPDGVLVPRLVTAELGDAGEWPSGTVLITGGTGALGALVARHLAAPGRHLLLASRSGRAPDLADELREHGAEVTVAAVDVADRAALAALLDTLPDDKPLRAIVHAAGVLDDATVLALTPEQLATVLRPKVDAAWHLHELAPDVERFVLFSSAVAAVGAPGQANYAAANSFLDALATHRRAQGQAATSIGWGLWSTSGVMTDHLTADDHTRLARRGIGLIAPDFGLDVLDSATHPHLIASTLDIAVLRKEAVAGTLSPLFATLVGTPIKASGSAWTQRLRGAADPTRTLVALLREQTAAVLGHPDATRVDTDRAFKDLGFDSLTAVELRNRLTAQTGLRLPATLVFEHPSVTALADHLLPQLTTVVHSPHPNAPKLSSPTTTLELGGPTAAQDQDFSDPVVIVGMGCRFPGGVTSPEDLWRLVLDGRDATGDFPTDRGWDLDTLYAEDPDRPGTTYTRRGGFLHDAADFDAEFFGMSPREALATDPQQRLLLQITWEALERAGIDPLSLKGSDTGVFIGAMYEDYASRLREVPAELEGLLLAGNQSSVASGRIAYVLGLSGPALTVDTACSSSLVALDLAVRSVRSGESTRAIAGGVAVMASPGVFVEFARQRGLSADGRCRAFAADADGTGWSEGAGVVVVERLSTARAAGHPVLAVVRGSAVNQDGASNGLTAPNGAAQEAVIRKALAAAALAPGDVQAIEAHGTGTRLGDPIEARALITVYGGTRATPALLGSLKSNIGHTQAAAGIGGVIKMVQSLRHGVLPRTLHAENPTPHVDWRDAGVTLATATTPWPATDRRRGAVSAFGISGTNTHVVLEQSPDQDPEPTPDTTDLLVLSARTEQALRAQAARLVDAPNAGYTLARRARFGVRAAVRGAEGLRALAEGRELPGKAGDGRLGVLFSGQGSQRAGMGARLLGDGLDEIAEHLDPLLDVPLRDLVLDAELLKETRYAQPALFAVEIAGYREIEKFGITPDVLIGHSIGEFAAAHVAGVLSLPDAAKIVVARGRLMQSARPGAMAAVEATVEEAEAFEHVEIAAVNGPRAVVVSGDADAVDAVVADWKAGGHRATRLRVGHAFHSAHMDDVLDEFRAVLATATFHEPRVPIASTALGRITDEVTDPEYWVRQLRGRVRFAEAVEAAHADGVTTFLEVGPDGGLAAAARQTVDVVAVPLLRPGKDEFETRDTALGALFTAGVPVDLTPLYPRGHVVDLPTYPFQTRRYWIDATPGRGDATGLGLTPAPHPLLGAVVDLPDGGLVATGLLAANTFADHRIDGRTVVPAVALLDVITALVGPNVDDFVVHRPVEVEQDTRLRVTVTPGGDVTIAAGPDWDTHATAARGTATDTPTAPRTTPADPTDPYRELAGNGYEYGPTFRGLRAIARVGDTVQAEVEVPESAHSAIALLDAALHALVIERPNRVPFAFDGVWYKPGTARRATAFLTEIDTDTYRVLVTADGEPVFRVDRLRLRGHATDADLYTVRWTPTATSDSVPHVVVDVTDVDQVRRAVLTDGPRIVFRANGIHTPEVAAAWGFIRAAQAERPGRFALLDTDGTAPDTAEFPEASIRAGRVHRPRLVPAGNTPDTPDLTGGTVLITGGTGALGTRLVRHLRERHGVGEVVVVSRGGRAVEGARSIALDITDADAVAVLLTELGPLTAVIHAAAIAEDAIIERVDPEALRRTFDVKVRAAQTLDELTREHPPAAFVLFGSVAGVLGTAGQAAYAAANSALDAVARARVEAGLPATVVHWGLWDLADGLAGGLAARDRERLAAAGIRPLTETDGLALFDRVLGVQGSVTAARLDLGAVARHRAFPVTATASGDLDDVVRTAIAAVLGHDSAADIDRDRPFTELGFDSLMAVDLRNRLTDRLGTRLPTTIVFDHPTAAALTDHLRTQLSAVIHSPHPNAPKLSSPATKPELGGPTAARDQDSSDPVVIVGMACRFPGGVRTPDDLWTLLRDGTDAITEFPTDRGWDPALFDPDPDHPGTSTVRHGGFLHDAADFDPTFFGISPREALAVDPQQRLLLHTAWEAVEDAGIDPTTLRGSQSGVFVGVMYSDYGARLHQRPGASGDLEGWLVSGSAGSVASGRVAYTLGLEGPAVTVDTACSSSLVALHQAAQALRAGECDLALAGGATVMASPATFIEFSRQRGLAPDGRCKPFSADADGTAWAEGAGILVLERLSDARRHGHRVLAVVRGSAVNSDGASNGLTAPNGPSQERVIRRALGVAGLRPADIDVLEAHGTGTRLGDPIEAGAVLATYGADRAGRAPLRMGSVKSNLGHTQAAAGVAGVIKLVQAMRHRELPATLHLREPSPHVDWSAGTVVVPAETTPWDTDGPRRAAVSSFGIGGTNAHVILEEGPDPATPDRPDDGTTRVWALSAKTPEGLRSQAARLAEHVRTTDPDLTDLAFSLVTTRTRFPVRGAVVGASREDLLRGLDHLAAGTTGDGVVTGSPAKGAVALLFTGQGSQRTGMGTALRSRFPVYADAFDAVADEFGRHGIDVRAAIAGTELDQTRNTQAALFTVEVALARLLESWGLVAAGAAGHSIGELAAAHAVGALSLADAVAVVAARGTLMQALPTGGAMVSVRAAVDEIPDGVDIAAVNGPNSVVLSGPEDVVTAVAAGFARTKRLTVSHAFHSALMDPMLPGFRDAIGTLDAREPAYPLLSTVTAAPADARRLGSADHWVDQVRGTVRFADTVAALGAGVFVEVGPDAVLTTQVGETLPDAVALPALTRRADDLTAVWTLVARGFVAGIGWDWRALYPEAAPIPLPTYAFARERYWLDAPALARPDAPGHPLLTGAVTIPDTDQTVYTGLVSLAAQPWLADHAVLGTTLVPAVALVELVGWLGARHGKPVVEELVLHAPLIVTETVDLRVTVDGDSLRVHSRVGDEPWSLNAEATVADSGPEDVWDGHRPAAEPVPVSYQALAALGYDYGPAFRNLIALWRDGDHRYADVAPASAVGALDAVLHAWIADREPGAPVEIPYAWRGVRTHTVPEGPLRARITSTGADSFAVSVIDRAGRPVLTADEVRLRPTSGLGGVRVPAPYEVVWVPTPLPSGNAEVRVVEPDTSDPRAAFREVRDLILTAPEHVVVVTRGAVAAVDGDTVADPNAAVLWGLVRTARAERPGRVSVIDTDDDPSSIAALSAIAAGRPGEVALRRGGVSVPRLHTPTRSDTPVDFGDGTVLLSGAGGALGAAVARHLADTHGVRKLLLVSRRGQADPALRALGEELGAEVRAADLADTDATRALLDTVPDLTAVIHAAGVLADGVLENLTDDDVDRVFRAKVDAAWTLHHLTADRPLRVFALFSSIAGVIGNAGQANYAAANTFLDALAAHRQASGLPGTSLAFGLWDTGMGAELDAAHRARIAGLGLRAATIAEGLVHFDAALSSGRATTVPALISARPGGPEIFADLVPRQKTTTVTLVERVSTVDVEAARRIVRTTVADRITEVLGLAVVPDDTGLFDLGLDSLTAIELRTKLGLDIGGQLPATLLFDHPTAAALTTHLLDLVTDTKPDLSALDALVSTAHRDDNTRADIIAALKAALADLGDTPDAFGVDSATDDELFGLLDKELSE